MRLNRTIMALLLALSATAAAAQHTIPLEDLPEEVRKLIPPGAILAGPPRTDGYVVYDPPIVAAARQGSHSLAPGAIVFEQSAKVPEARRATDGAIRIGAPFDIILEPGAIFARVLQKDGVRPCRARPDGETFEPAADEKGEIYPGLCLVDGDEDGAFETARLFPYRMDRAAPRDVPIAPIRLHASLPADHPRAAGYGVHRRIRVTGADDGSATFLLEEAMVHSARPGELVWHGVEGVAVTIPLRAGAEVAIGGIGLEIEGGPGAWRVASSGGSAPWIAPLPDGTGFRSAMLRIDPRPH